MALALRVCHGYGRAAVRLWVIFLVARAVQGDALPVLGDLAGSSAAK